MPKRPDSPGRRLFIPSHKSVAEQEESKQTKTTAGFLADERKFPSGINSNCRYGLATGQIGGQHSAADARRRRRDEDGSVATTFPCIPNKTDAPIASGNEIILRLHFHAPQVNIEENAHPDHDQHTISLSYHCLAWNSTEFGVLPSSSTARLGSVNVIPLL